MNVRNNANLVIRKLFAETDQMQAFRRIVYKAMSTAYQMTEEVGEFGSGTPSPLHKVFEMVRELKEIGEREGWTVNYALELAGASLDFYKQLCGDGASHVDASGKMALLIQSAANANFLLDKRGLADLSIEETGKFNAYLSDVATVARELVMSGEAHITNTERNHRGQPEQGERAIRMPG
jgi:hypothetical protein